MTWNKPSIGLASCSDVHLGHPRVPTAHISDNFLDYVANPKLLADVDFLFIAGDFFDRLLTLDSQDAMIADHAIMVLLQRCALSGVILRVLEGTPSHDRGQSIRFIANYNKLSDDLKSKLDLKYVSELSVEKHEGLGVTILYVPDEWRPTPDITLSEVRDLLQREGLSSVDIAIMHGMFEHQCGDIPNAHFHDRQAYEDVVEHLILIGHVHTFSHVGKAIAHGSFDRLAHNEEEPKGFIKARLFQDKTALFEFIENKKAKRFVTVKCHHEEVTDNIKLIDGVVKDLPAGSFVRVWSDKTNPILTNMKVIAERWPLINWSSIGKERDVRKPELLIDSGRTYSPIPINRQNIAQVMQDRLVKKGYEPRVVTQALMNLHEINKG